ncbi:hypothetical protein [Streptomyces sp. NPDC051211]|uniref:hypothetical protein n=1 Tax=Streptomyces sp. NPDC051211 TaxID=3154643 RepID=UPI003450A682
MAEAISEQADQTGDATNPPSDAEGGAPHDEAAPPAGAGRIVEQRPAPEEEGEAVGESSAPNGEEEEEATPTSEPDRRVAAREPSPKGQLVVQWAQTRMAGVAALAAIGALIYTAQTTRATVETVDLTAKGQITERYTAAVGQLGDDELAVRLGGIYALERSGRRWAG